MRLSAHLVGFYERTCEEVRCAHCLVCHPIEQVGKLGKYPTCGFRFLLVGNNDANAIGILLGKLQIPCIHPLMKCGAGKLDPIINLILKAVPLAMGVAVVVTATLGELGMRSGFTMLGVGLACIGACLLKEKN